MTSITTIYKDNSNGTETSIRQILNRYDPLICNNVILLPLAFPHVCCSVRKIRNKAHLMCKCHQLVVKLNLTAYLWPMLYSEKNYNNL